LQTHFDDFVTQRVLNSVLRGFVNLIWPPLVTSLLVRPERRPKGGAEAGPTLIARQQLRFCSGFSCLCLIYIQS